MSAYGNIDESKTEKIIESHLQIRFLYNNFTFTGPFENLGIGISALASAFQYIVFYTV